MERDVHWLQCDDGARSTDGAEREQHGVAHVKHRCVAWLCVSRVLAHEHPHRMTRLELSSVDIALVRWNCS